MEHVNVSIMRRGATSWRIKTRVKKDGVWSEETETLRGTRQQAEARKALILSQFRGGERLQLTLDTVAAHFTGWIEYRLAIGSIRPSSARNYRIMLKPVLEALGSIKLSSLSVDQCRMFVATDARDNGVKAAKQRYIIAKASFTAAVKEGKISSNPYSRFDPPKVPKTAGKGTLDQQKLNELYKASYDHDVVGLAVRIAIATGLRRGELAGLRWCDVERGAIHVRQIAVRTGEGYTFGLPKTESSLRRVTIPAHLSEELERLRKDGDLLVLGDIHPETLAHYINNLLPSGFTVHDLRHAHATALLQAGLPVKAVAQRLGHADVTTTLRVYAHAMPQDEEAAVAAIDAVVGSGRLRAV